MLIFSTLTTFFVMTTIKKEIRQGLRRGDLELVIYSGQILLLIHIHSSSVPHVCPALKKANNRYPSLSSRSPLSTHYPSSAHFCFYPYSNVCLYFHVKQEDIFINEKYTTYFAGNAHMKIDFMQNKEEKRPRITPCLCKRDFWLSPI